MQARQDDRASARHPRCTVAQVRLLPRDRSCGRQPGRAHGATVCSCLSCVLQRCVTMVCVSTVCVATVCSCTPCAPWIGTGTQCRQLPGYDAPEQLAQVARHRTLRLGSTWRIDGLCERPRRFSSILDPSRGVDSVVGRLASEIEYHTDAQAPLPKQFAVGERGTGPCLHMTLQDLVVESYEVFKFPDIPFASDERFERGLIPLAPVARAPFELVPEGNNPAVFEQAATLRGSRMQTVTAGTGRHKGAKQAMEQGRRSSCVRPEQGARQGSQGSYGAGPEISESEKQRCEPCCAPSTRRTTSVRMIALTQAPRCCQAVPASQGDRRPVQSACHRRARGVHVQHVAIHVR